MRALLTADNHLGKGQDLGRTPGERLTEQEACWRRTLELSRELNVDAVLHGGDLFDGRRPGPEIMLAAERPLVEHIDADGAQVLLCAGNHDVPSQDGDCGLDVLAEAGLIHLSRHPCTWEVGGVVIAALPWTPVARLLAQRDGVPRDQVYVEAAELIVQTARDLRSERPGAAILLSHWAVSGTTLPNGLDVGSLSGVVLPMEELAAVGFDAMVFGHIHSTQRVGDFIYTGSPMPLDFGEARDDHGCWVWDSETGFEFHRLPSRSFVTLEHLDEVDLARVDDAYVKVRATLNEDETRRFDIEDWRRRLEAEGAHKVWFDLTIERERRERGAALAEDLSRPQQLARYLEAVGVNGSTGARMRETAEAYLS